MKFPSVKEGLSGRLAYSSGYQIHAVICAGIWHAGPEAFPWLG